MGEVIRMTEAQAKKAYALAKKNCCNCYDGFCVLFDTPCPQCITRSLICKWFIQAVLPADTPLYVEITGDNRNTRLCEKCGEPFVSRSNRAKYCKACASAVRKQKQREYVRKMRAGC